MTITKCKACGHHWDYEYTRKCPNCFGEGVQRQNPKKYINDYMARLFTERHAARTQ